MNVRFESPSRLLTQQPTWLLGFLMEKSKQTVVNVQVLKEGFPNRKCSLTPNVDQRINI